jgi:impB/mucB/samB family
MRRVISLFLPRWPSDRLRRASRDAPARDRPLVTALMHGQRRVLASVDESAERLGLASGMTVTHAQSLVPDLCVVNATPDEDETALLRLALWCIRYSPLVTLDLPDGIFIDVAGSAHLFQGEVTLLKDLCQRLAAQGITSRAAIADTPGCAWAVARFGGGAIVRRTATPIQVPLCAGAHRAGDPGFPPGSGRVRTAPAPAATLRGARAVTGSVPCSISPRRYRSPATASPSGSPSNLRSRTVAPQPVPTPHFQPPRSLELASR